MFQIDELFICLYDAHLGLLAVLVAYDIGYIKVYIFNNVNFLIAVFFKTNNIPPLLHRR